MHPVGHESGPGHTTHLWIDTIPLLSCLPPLICFSLILVRTITLGFTRDSVISQTAHRTISPTNATATFDFEAAPLSPSNRFISFDLALLRTPPHVPLPFSFSFQLETTRSGASQRHPPVALDSLPFRFPPGANTSRAVRLLHDRFITYTSITLRLSLPPRAPLAGIAVSTRVGARAHTVFQVCFRVFYAAGEVASLYFGYLRARGALLLEQEVVLPPLLLAVLAGAPLHLAQLRSPSRRLAELQLILTVLFHAALYFAVAVAVANVRERRTGGFALRVFRREAVWPVALALLELLEEGMVALGLLYRAALCGFALAQGAALARGWREMEAADAGRVCVCAAALAMLLALAGGMLGGWDASRELPERTREWVASFCVHNGVVLMLSYFFWPDDGGGKRGGHTQELGVMVEQVGEETD